MLLPPHIKLLFSTFLASGILLTTHAQIPSSWKEEFKTPPAAAHPRTWWHWTQSNVTKDGITKDLEWMKRVGIAGFQLADVNAGGGQTVDKKVVFGTPEWKEAVRWAASEANRLGLEMAVFSSPGWSLTGGPWVKPEQAMKKLVWSETRINGGATFHGRLPQPPAQEGPGPNLAGTPIRPGAPHFYADFAVVAYHTPAGDTIENDPPVVTTLSGREDYKILHDENMLTGISVKAGPEKTAWLQLTYPQPVLARSITLGCSKGIPYGRIMAGNDSNRLHTIATLPGKSGYRGGNIRTYAFPATTAKYYRIEFTNDPPRPADVISQATTPADSTYILSELALHADGRVNRWEDKAGFNFLFEYSGVATPAVPDSAVIDPASITDLTSHMQPDGTLNWDVPAGHWTVIRFGYALTGAKNRPAVPAALGYEVDKMNRKHVEAYIQHYTQLLQDATGPFFGKSLQYVMMDSWEAGIQNWTDDMPAQFERLRGYSIFYYLPILTGHIVGDAGENDRFLWDFRRTLVDLIAENHYGTITAYLNKKGIKTYGEAGGVSLESIEDALLNKKYVNIPMGEFWVKDLHPSSMYYEDMRGAASASHIYGSNIVAAESFTGGNYESPATLKHLADYWFSQGLNRLVFHTSAHQPLDTKPGNTMVGTHINRNITWAENAAPFITHLSRCSYLLQKGTYVADIAYLLDEGAPSTMPFWGAGLQPAPPEGYQFDYINTDVLLNLMTVGSDGRLHLPSGMSYAILVLPPTQQMSLSVLMKIRDLVAEGATVVGPKPIQAPSPDRPRADARIREIAMEVWADLDGFSRTVRNYGKGHICWNMPLVEVLSAIHITRDITVDRMPGEVAWTHRRDGNTDIYYVVNRTDLVQDLSLTFRTAGKDVSLWNPDNGEVTPSSYTLTSDHTLVPLRLGPKQNLFVVFSGYTPPTSRSIPAKPVRTLAIIEGPWQLTFPPNSGAPSEVQLPELSAWTDSKDDGIKYFSGTAIYTNTITIKPDWLKSGSEVWLDMGRVNDMAEVWVNGQKTDLVYDTPFRVNIGKSLHPGNNQLEIKITNEWTNRLFGDNANPDKKVLDAYIRPYGGPYTLQPSGLLGPVQLLSITDTLAPKPPPTEVAGIHVNYDEDSVGAYTLPDPLIKKNGRKVSSAADWTGHRRPEILKLFETQQYGKVPARPEDMTWNVFDKGTPVLGGKAIRKQVTIYFTKDTSSVHKVDLLIYLPAHAAKPSPLLLNISFSANNNAVDDPGVKPGMAWSKDGQRIPAPPGRFGKMNVEQFIDAGFGFATFCYTDIEPDQLNGIRFGIRSVYLRPGQTVPAPDEWGAISAFSWGASRVMDYLETDKDIDAKKVALTGASRLGKTVLWTGARDTRFAMIIASVSGEGGAALSRRNYGETIAHLVAPTRYPYQFAGNYARYGPDPKQLPVDGHMLIALMAPRPVLLQTGSTDGWSDPKGEWLAALAAKPVFELFKETGPSTDKWPSPEDSSQLLHHLGYFMHDGPHGVLPTDWPRFIEFMKKYL